jgi:Fe-S cluster biogenesis protein NfuA
MDVWIEEILNRLRPGIEGDGGSVTQLPSTGNGAIRLCLKEKCSLCYSVLWTHRLRIERAIHQANPSATVMFVRGEAPNVGSCALK